MKILTLTLLLLSSVAVAQHPYDFVSDDALAILTIKDGKGINTILKSVNEASGMPSADPNVLETYLAQYFKNPSAVDLSSEAVVLVEPTKLASGDKPAGMFGPMPHMVVICKEKKGQKLELATSGALKTTTSVDGWFIATGADQWSPRNTKGLSPIFANLPDAQVSSTVKFGAIWSKFGPIVQMTGGIAIGMLNKPGPDGVISPEANRSAATARKLFGFLTKWCTHVQDVSIGIDFDGYTIVTNVDVKMKEQPDITIDNKSMEAMASILPGSMTQYAMSGRFTKLLLEMDVESLQGVADKDMYVFPVFVNENLKTLASLSRDHAGTYGLDSKSGLTLSSIASVSNQEMYLKEIQNVVSKISSLLLTTYSLKLEPSNTKNTWDVAMMGSDEGDQNILNAIVHKNDKLRFNKQGANRITMAFGPQSWKPFGQPRSTPLAQVIRKYMEGVDIDFAMSFNARELIAGISEISHAVNPSQTLIQPTPSAKSSLLLGMTHSGGFIEIQSDLMGLATLMSDIK